jgi:hypothetical protein
MLPTCTKLTSRKKKAAHSELCAPAPELVRVKTRVRNPSELWLVLKRPLVAGIEAPGDRQAFCPRGK